MSNKEIEKAKEHLASLERKEIIAHFSEVVNWCKNFKMELDEDNLSFHRTSLNGEFCFNIWFPNDICDTFSVDLEALSDGAFEKECLLIDQDFDTASDLLEYLSTMPMCSYSTATATLTLSASAITQEDALDLLESDNKRISLEDHVTYTDVPILWD